MARSPSGLGSGLGAHHRCLLGTRAPVQVGMRVHASACVSGAHFASVPGKGFGGQLRTVFHDCVSIGSGEESGYRTQLGKLQSWLQEAPPCSNAESRERPGEPQRRARPGGCLGPGLEGRSHLAPLVPALLWGDHTPMAPGGSPLVLRDTGGGR